MGFIDRDTLRLRNRVRLDLRKRDLAEHPMGEATLWLI